MPSVQDVADLLNEFGSRAALAGGNPYRARAYRTAAENILAVDEPLDVLIRENRLTQIPGVGDALAEVIRQVYKTGSHPKLEKLRKEVPDAALELASIPGIRAEQAIKLYESTRIGTLAQLESDLRAGKLDKVKGMTPAFKDKILQGIGIKTQNVGKIHIHRAEEILHSAQKKLEAAGFTKVTPAGEFRRRCETVGDLTLVVISPEGGAVPKTQGVTVMTAPPDAYESTLMMATGSSPHIEELQDIARSKKMSLTPQGLFKGKKLAARTEKEIYAALGLQYIPPERREGMGEIKLAAANKIVKPVTDKDIKGILHAHTTRSDGVHTLEQMAEATRERGYQYFGVADHSRSAHYAGGLQEDEVLEQHKEIAKLNRKYGSDFRIFKGIESDILADGSLDYPDSFLKKFDFVVASVHSKFKLPRGEQTARIIAAVRNPYTTVLGHMTGRQLLRRPGYDVDVEAVLEACADCGVAVEINANPWRLDFDWRWHQKALELGCMVSINPDAHSTSEIDLTRWGVAMAQKGGVPKKKVLNCLSLAEFERFLKRK